MKQLVMEKYIEALQKKYESAKKSFEIAKHDTIEAEGRMVTRYDSTKTETAWLADGYQQTMLELDHGIEFLKSNRVCCNYNAEVELSVYRQREFVETKHLVIDAKLKNENRALFDSVIGLGTEDRFSLQTEGQMCEYIVGNIKNAEGMECVGINSIVAIEDEYGYEDYFFIVRAFGGDQVEVEGKEIYCVACQAPMANALLGCVVGDEVSVNGVSYKIKDIQ